MKFSTVKEKILNAVALAERVVGKKESLPVLSCVLFDAKKEFVVRATNLEAGVEVRVPCEIEEAGVAAVPAVVLSQTLRSVASEKISFHSEDGNVVIESRGSRTLIKAVPHDEFPPLSAGEKKGVVLSREELLRGIQSVAYAASPSMIRPELGSVYVTLGHKGLTCVATDSFRLAEKVIPIASAKKEEVELLIPLKHALELSQILERLSSDTVEVAAGDSQLSVAGDGARYVSRVVDGTFPNYHEIIPKTYSTEATVLKGEFAEMLRKAKVFSGAEQHVGLHVYPKKKIFSAIARSSDVGEMSDSIDAALSGDDLDISFHIGYLSDCLGAIQSDSITLSFAGAGKPLVIRGASDPSFTYLVMPLNR